MYKKIRNIILLFVLCIPLSMYIWWLLSPKKPLVMGIIDKTVLNEQTDEHKSLWWILNQQKFSKNVEELYNRNRDYFGFFPLDNEQYMIKSLESLDDNIIEQLANESDAVYITDAYGIYKNEWFKRGDAKERSGIIYGGMSEQDMLYLKKMKEQHKLIITEFNCLGSPTKPEIREQFRETFGVHWTGWIGRYFHSLDTATNKEIPRWLVRNYMLQNNQSWPFKKSGIALVREDDRVVILENETHLTKELPYLNTSKEAQNYYGLPQSIKYSFWFDIVEADTSFNKVLANFKIYTNSAGKKQLKNYNIPDEFPSIIRHVNADYRFFYFAADFSDNPIYTMTSYFKGIGWFKWMFYNHFITLERKSFFWEVYRPLVTRILEDYYKTLPPKKLLKQ